MINFRVKKIFMGPFVQLKYFNILILSKCMQAYTASRQECMTVAADSCTVLPA